MNRQLAEMYAQAVQELAQAMSDGARRYWLTRLDSISYQIQRA